MTTVFFCAIILLIGTVLAHSNERKLSPLYQRYKSSGRKNFQPATRYYDVSTANPTGTSSQGGDLFFPPLPGQSSVDYHPVKRVMADNDTQIIYYSWHLHVYFFHEDKNVTDRLLQLKDNFTKRFSLATCNESCFMGGPFDSCTQGKSSVVIFHFIYFLLIFSVHNNLGMCVWDPVYGVDGPHPYGNWGAYVPNEYVAPALAWFSMNHGEFPVFFHPNTGYQIGDHDPNRRAIWIKQQVPLDMDFLVWAQCEYFGCSDLITLEKVKF
jgi:aromatic ring-cleaving dioxygenase